MADESKVVVITGASAGVGRAVARAFAQKGARIGLLARGYERLEDTATEVRELGGEAIALPTDVADPEQVEAAATTVEEVFGPIDVWVNNAMVTVMARCWDVTPEEYRRVTDVTFHGTVYGTQAALRRMRRRDRGVIVQVGSALAYRGIPVQAPYCASKHAIVGFTESLRTELLAEESGVHVTLVHLPAVNTPQFLWSRNKMPNKPQPVPPIFQPEVCADAIVWASEHDRREIMVGLPTVKAVWGNRLAPGIADMYLAKKGVASQLTDEPEVQGRADNLFGPAPGRYGAHGPFDEQAQGSSGQLFVTTHRKSLFAAAAGTLLLLAGAGALLMRGKKRTDEDASRAREEPPLLPKPPLPVGQAPEARH